MKVIILFVSLNLFFSVNAFSQKYSARNAQISFHSSTPIEDIDAKSSQATCVFDSDNGEVAWAVLMKSFKFKKALMQEHFNENYVESSKYPKATFKGKIKDYNKSMMNAKGVQEVTVEGEMTIHGVEKPFKSKATMEIKDTELLLLSSFQIVPEDYNITIPKLVRDKIAKVIEVKVNALCQPLNK